MCITVISPLTCNRCPWHRGREDKRPLVVVLETVCFRHAVIHIEVCCQRNLLSRHCLFHPASSCSFLAFTRWWGTPFWVRPWLGACIWEGSEARHVGLSVRTDVRCRRETRTWWKRFLEHPGTKHWVACFPLVRSPLAGSKVRQPCCTKLTLAVQLKRFCRHIAGRVVWQAYMGTLRIRGCGLAVTGEVSAFSILWLRESKIIRAVPFWAAGFCNVPQVCTFSSVPSTVCHLLLLTLPAVRARRDPLRRPCFSGGTRRVLWFPSTEKEEIN